MMLLKMRLFFLCILLLSPFISANGQDRQVCFTVDDLPTVSYGIGGNEHRQHITRGLVDAFVRHQVPAIGYVNESKLYVDGTLDSAEVQLLDYCKVSN